MALGFDTELDKKHWPCRRVEALSVSGTGPEHLQHGIHSRWKNLLCPLQRPAWGVPGVRALVTTTWSLMNHLCIGLNFDTSMISCQKPDVLTFGSFWKHFDPIPSGESSCGCGLRSGGSGARRGEASPHGPGDRADQVDSVSVSSLAWTPAAPGNSSPLQLGECFRDFLRHVSS